MVHLAQSNFSWRLIAITTLLLLLCFPLNGQRKRQPRVAPKPANELESLREQFVKATGELKSSLAKLQAIYARNVQQAEERLALSRKLLDEGLIARKEFEENERILAAEKTKLTETQRQIELADTQVAAMLVEAKAADELAKTIRGAKGLTRTTAMIRYHGTGNWALADAWKVQRFFSESFRKSLPIAVFGQGAIHDRWRLDHRNAMDISLHPDGAEGRALMAFLQQNGIPFLAFREAIPGTATGPHIHIGRPSHRY